MKLIKISYLTVIAALTLASCSSIKNVAVPSMDTKVSMTAKKGEIDSKAFDNWAHADLATDTIPGISIEKAYNFLEGKTGETVIVGVIDSGIDIEHEDLKDVIWTNEKEIAGNGIDDDKNGYIDDIHGWNFLGGDGVAAPEQLEITRLVAEMNKRFEGKTIDQVSDDDKTDFLKYEKYLEAFNNSAGPYLQQMERLTLIEANFNALKKHLGTDVLTVENVKGIKTTDAKLQAQAADVSSLLERGFTEKAFYEYYEGQKKSKNYDLNFDGRAIVGDNPTDIKDTKYGNGNVIGSKDEESHGTHVSGIILASRNNGVGLNGIAKNAILMSIRAVPDGDERDKDVALAIRYAVDNGAKVVNMSFGKNYSPNKEWVFDAIKYAAKHDVLLVHAAGNDGKNIDIKPNFPNDSEDKITEIADNLLTVGAMSSAYDENLPAKFSNYGKTNVDVFAPGVQIYSTVPKDEYARYNGTSMASPEVAGVAALVRSYYPELSASQVKHIIMKSGTKVTMDVLIPGENEKKASFTNLSISGNVLNAYNALVLAEKMVNPI